MENESLKTSMEREHDGFLSEFKVKISNNPEIQEEVDHLLNYVINGDGDFSMTQGTINIGYGKARIQLTLNHDDSIKNAYLLLPHTKDDGWADQGDVGIGWRPTANFDKLTEQLDKEEEDRPGDPDTQNYKDAIECMVRLEELVNTPKG